MQRQPLDYETPTGKPGDGLRRTMARLAKGAWLVFGIASALLWFNASDQNSLQRPSAVFMALAMFVAVVLTVIYAVVSAVLWFRNR